MELHRQAEQYMAQAEALTASGDIAEAHMYFRKAAAEETLAFDRIPAERQRTRGIIAVSAVSLSWRAAEFNQAIQRAHYYLSLPDISEAAHAELEDLLLEIQRAKQAQLTGQAYGEDALEFSFRGSLFEHGLAPLDMLLLKFEQLKRLLVRTAEWTAGRPFRQDGQASEDIHSLFRPLLGTASAGSYRVQLRIQTPLQPRLFTVDENAAPTPEQIGSAFFSVLRLASSGLREEVEEQLPDVLYRETLLKLVRNFAPSEQGLSEIEVADRARHDRAPVTLTRDIRRQIQQVLPRQVRAPQRDVEPIGTLRALHLDEGWLVLVEEGKEQRYDIAGDTMFDDVVGPFVNRRVRLLGRRQGKRFVVDDIELAETPPLSTGP